MSTIFTQIIKERICSFRIEFFPFLRANPFWKGLAAEESEQSQKFSPFGKMAEKKTEYPYALSEINVFNFQHN